MKKSIASIVLGVFLGSLAAMGHVSSVQAAQPKMISAVIPYEEHQEEKTVIVYMDDEIPDEVEIAAYKYGEEYGISPEMLEAMAFYESTYRPGVDNGNCKGLMQINVKFHKDRMERLGVTNLHDVDQNMNVAADYLAELIDEYGDTVTVLSKYAGSSTSKYANKILRKAEELEIKHNK